jgi:hypothetical protein
MSGAHRTPRRAHKSEAPTVRIQLTLRQSLKTFTDPPSRVGGARRTQPGRGGEGRRSFTQVGCGGGRQGSTQHRRGGAAAGQRTTAARRPECPAGQSAHCPAGLGDCPAARSEMRCTRSAQYTGRERIRWREMKRWGNFLAPGFRGCPAGRSAFFPTDCGMSQKLLPTPLKTL